MKVIDFGIADYQEILSKQEIIFHKLIESKQETPFQPNPEEKKISKRRSNLWEKECILLGEHFPVITLGRRADSSNLLFSEADLKKRGISVYRIKRGGDVTYHSQGQLIVYPILDLEARSLGVKNYVELLEGTVIDILDNYGIKGERIEGATGVWIGKNTPEERKICAIGIQCSRFCTMHGLALNINTDLSGFSLIHPCGFINKGVTSLEKEIGKKIEMEEVKEEILQKLKTLLFKKC